ncbi:MAG: hypothetical protein WCO45_13585 [Pseudanabaena sp. ELA607]
MKPTISRVALTIATGKPIYIQMAVNLARSFKWWHKDSDIKFAIATDQAHLVPPDLSDIQIIKLQPNQYGQGFSPKLHLDKIAPADKTLFVDADCLCVGSLESVFERFAGHDVSVVGGTISEGEWFGNISAVCQRFNVQTLPKFNGGIYYLEKGEISDQVYATARELEPQYDEIGLIRLRNCPNDELLMAISMAIHDQTPISDDGSIMSDPQACQGGITIDVFRGISKLINPNFPHPKHQSWYPFHEVNPVVVHFLGYYTSTYPYTREALRLQLVQTQNFPLWLSELFAIITITIPFFTTKTVKNSLRPIYHYFFGYRLVSKSNRI